MPAPANRRDDSLLAATLDTAAATLSAVQGPPVAATRSATVHLDTDYDSQSRRQAPADRGLQGEIATRGHQRRFRRAAAG